VFVDVALQVYADFFFHYRPVHFFFGVGLLNRFQDYVAGAEIRGKADAEASKLCSDAKAEAARIQAQVDARREDAVRLVLDAVSVV
jgi:hypothetical protein